MRFVLFFVGLIAAILCVGGGACAWVLASNSSSQRNIGELLAWVALLCLPTGLTAYVCFKNMFTPSTPKVDTNPNDS